MLVEFTYDSFCQGTRDTCQTFCLIPDARSLEEAIATIREKYYAARDFKSRTHMSVWREDVSKP